MKKNFILGLAEIAAGVLIASPADEALLAGTLAPAQLPVTFIAGAALVYDGLNRL